jgi:uncharacterized protein (TIGR02145 family)
VSFTTLEAPITDFDGNVYTKVTIGEQVWMVGDLRATHFKNGDHINTKKVYSNAEWIALTTPAYCWFNDDSVTYPNAVFYNWYAVATGNICPTGWHVPSNAEFTTLADFLGGQDIAGGPLKALTGWDADAGGGATNSTGFSAMANGYRYDHNTSPGGEGSFTVMGGYASWFTSTEFTTDPLQGYQWWASYNMPNFSQSNVFKEYGSPVRCIKDN